MTPTEESKKRNKGTIYFMFGDMHTKIKPKFKVGDKVRISKCKRKAL